MKKTTQMIESACFLSNRKEILVFHHGLTSVEEYEWWLKVGKFFQLHPGDKLNLKGEKVNAMLFLKM